MLIPIRRDRTSKPPLGTPLRADGHWSVQGLASWAFNEGAGSRIVSSRNSFASAVSPLWSPNGPKVASSDQSWVSNMSLAGPLLTVMVGFSPLGAPISLSRVASNHNGSSYSFILGPYSVSFMRMRFNLNTGTGTDLNDPDPYPASGDHVFCGVYDASKMYLYRGGVLKSSVIKTGSIQNLANVLAFGANSDLSGAAPNFLYNFAYVWARVLASSEVSSLSANPWQIYEPETVWIEVGGGGETKNLIAAISANSYSSSVLANISRELASGVAGQSTTPSIQAKILRNLLCAVSGVSETSTNAATISRALLASVISSSLTPSVAAAISSIISLVASIPAQSLSSTAQVTIDRALTAIISGQSGTPSISALIQGIISLVASISGQASTPAIAVTTARLLLAAINGGSVTASARTSTARTLSAVVFGQSNTPDVAAMLANIVSLAANIFAESTTPLVMATLQRDIMAAIHTSTSTGAISAATSRALSAVVDGQSLTPDNIMTTLAGLGLVLDTSIESRTIIRALQSLTKKYTIHSI